MKKKKRDLCLDKKLTELYAYSHMFISIRPQTSQQTYFTEQHKQPFLSSSHSSNSSPLSPTDIDFSMESPRKKKKYDIALG